MLDEYCARYGVRGCKRHLFYLHELLNNAERGVAVDPSLMHYSFAFCASHVHGHRYVAHSDISTEVFVSDVNKTSTFETETKTETKILVTAGVWTGD